MGKSTASGMLLEVGLPVVDTDDLARAVVAPGEPALEEIARLFGREILAPDGTLKRSELARLVFSDPGQRKKLEEIVHPRIRERWILQARTWRQSGVEKGVVVIPLLFETGAEVHFDRTICVACSEGSQLGRLRERGWSLEEIEARRQAQWPIDKKMNLSDRVVWNEGELGIMAEQLRRIALI